MKQIIQNILSKSGYKLVKTEPEDDTALYKQLYGLDSVSNRRFYNISAGGHWGFGARFYHPCWTNIDLIREIPGERSFNPGTDIGHDLLDLKPLPLEDNSAELIFTQYSLEHITDQAADFFMKEAQRILKPGGVLRVVMPNNDLDYNAYFNNDLSYFHWIDMMSRKDMCEMLGYKTPLNQASFEQVFLVHFAANASPIHIGDNPNKISDNEFREVMHSMKKEDAFNYCTEKCSVEIQRKYRENHINWWNHDKVLAKLKSAGFKKTYILAPGQSNAPVMRNTAYFDNLWNNVALFIEAMKS